MEVVDRNNFLPEYYSFKVENLIDFSRIFYFDPQMRGRGEVVGSFWCRWNAHTLFHNTCQLKLFQYLGRFSHKLTELAKTDVIFKVKVDFEIYIADRKASTCI